MGGGHFVDLFHIYPWMPPIKTSLCIMSYTNIILKVDCFIFRFFKTSRGLCRTTRWNYKYINATIREIKNHCFLCPSVSCLWICEPLSIQNTINIISTRFQDKQYKYFLTSMIHHCIDIHQLISLIIEGT